VEVARITPPVGWWTEASDSSAGPTTHTCHLLRLPGELRNRIYDLADRSTPPRPSWLFACQRHTYIRRRYRPQSRLASTCRQIRHEALSAFFGAKVYRLRPNRFGLARPNSKYVELLNDHLRYIRSIKATLRAYSGVRRNEHHFKVEVRVHVTDDKNLVVTLTKSRPEYCACYLARHAKGMEGASDPPLIRYFMSSTWTKPQDGHCEVCGKQNTTFCFT